MVLHMSYYYKSVLIDSWFLILLIRTLSTKLLWKSDSTIDQYIQFQTFHCKKYENASPIFVFRIHLFLMPYNYKSGDTSLDDKETINYIIKLLQRKNCIYRDFYGYLSLIFNFIIRPIFSILGSIPNP